jgi:hypothetical protein
MSHNTITNRNDYLANLSANRQDSIWLKNNKK